jgi:hypothetical protein
VFNFNEDCGKITRKNNTTGETEAIITAVCDAYYKIKAKLE